MTNTRSRNFFIRALGLVLVFLLGFEPVVWAAPSITYLINDVAGSPIAATDETGNTVWRENYRPYGERIVNDPASATNRQFFHGKPVDTDTGLSYFGARYYDPVVGRFMGVDPNGFDDNNVNSFNRYAYGNDNPYKYFDPDGRAAMDWVHGGLTFASFCPSVCGAAFSAIDGGVSYVEGDRVGGGIAIAAAGVGMVSDAGLAKVAAIGLRRAKAGEAALDGEKIIYRMGVDKESAARLGRKAEEAETTIGKHGVSGSTNKPNVPCSSASCSSLEEAGFKVTKTPTRADPGHVTIELPKPVTPQDAKRFNDAFGR